MQPSSPASVFEAGSASLIRLAVESLTSDPSLTPEQARTRGEAVVCAIMAFLPSEPVQTMLASQAVGQHMMVLDTFRDIQNRSLSENGAVRMRMIASTLTRTTLSLIREIRVTRAAHRAAVLEERQAQRARAEWEAAQAREAAREATASAQPPSVPSASVQSPRVQAAPASVPPVAAPAPAQPSAAPSPPAQPAPASIVQPAPASVPVQPPAAISSSIRQLPAGPGMERPATVAPAGPRSEAPVRAAASP